MSVVHAYQVNVHLINECKLGELTVSSDREFHSRIAVGKKE